MIRTNAGSKQQHQEFNLSFERGELPVMFSLVVANLLRVAVAGPPSENDHIFLNVCFALHLLFVKKWEMFRKRQKSEEQLFFLVSCGWSLAMFLPVR